ncbi:MAG TPA: BadF/BadG/BcrA/BcrD ATPase family protein [Vicinamibacterales bacterium]
MTGAAGDGSGSYVLGIDAGGTKTVALLADAGGRIVGEARGAGANLHAVGELEVEKVLHDVMDRAIGDRHLLPSVICLGMAGVDRPGDAQVIRTLLRRISYKARVLIANDALIALVAGVGDAPGVVLIAGTGSIAYGRNAANEAARAGGWGYVLGDEGSGYWIGRHALRAVVREADGRGRATALTPLVLEHFGVRRPDELVAVVYERQLRPSAIAAVATAVQKAADAGDPVACEILATGARELAACAASVVNRLGLRDEAFTFVLAGGILGAVPRLANEVEAHLRQVAPRSTTRRLEREPAHGAVTLALAELNGGARLPAYKAS